MEYRIAICDDDKTAREYLYQLIILWSKEKESGAHVFCNLYSSSEEFLFYYEEDKSYDILLLDIEMKEMNGVDLAKRIRLENKELIIIFITGYSEYITDGYDVEALHYLLKPIQEDKLYMILDRAKDKIKKNEKALYLDTSTGVNRLLINEIRYIEVRLNYISIYGGETYTIKKTLSSMEKELDNRFVRCHRSYMVNLYYIRKIMRNEIILEDNTSIPLSKSYYELVNQAFINYF